MTDDSALSPSFLASFVRALAFLALPAERQIAWLKSLPVEVGNADELALEFDDGYQLFPQFVAQKWLPPALEPLIEVIARSLDEMSGPDGPWSFEDLAADARWEAVRAAATVALGAINKGVFIQ